MSRAAGYIFNMCVCVRSPILDTFKHTPYQIPLVLQHSELVYIRKLRVGSLLYVLKKYPSKQRAPNFPNKRFPRLMLYCVDPLICSYSKYISSKLFQLCNDGPKHIILLILHRFSILRIWVTHAYCVNFH